MIFIALIFQNTLYASLNKLAHPTAGNYPPINPWKPELKINTIAQQSQTVQSGYGINGQIQNSRHLLGSGFRTDPFEPLNQVSFSRFYYRYKSQSTTVVVGSYRIQIGEGITKNKGNSMYRRHTAWAGKSEDWGISENRGFDRSFPIQGLALKLPLINNHQIIASIGKAKLNGKFSDGAISTWYRNGLLTDSFKIANKHNFSCLSSTIAYRFCDKITTVGISTTSYRFSHKTYFSTQPDESSVNWLSSTNRDIQLSDKLPISTMVIPEIWASTTTKNGNLVFFHLTQQFYPIKSNPGNSIKYREFANRGKDLSTGMAVVLGIVVPLDKEQDISFRFQEYGRKFIGIEDALTSVNQGTTEFRCTWQNRITPQLNGNLAIAIMRTSAKSVLNQPMWQPQFQTKWIFNKYKYQFTTTMRLLQLNRTSSRDFEEFDRFTMLEDDFNPTFELNDLLFNRWRFYTHLEIKNSISPTSWAEIHCYYQSEFGKISSCLEWIYQNKIKNTLTIQSGIGAYNAQQTLMVQGLQLAPIQNYIGINQEGLLLFLGVKHKNSHQLSQWLHLQIMQNFADNRRFSARIFATVWFR